MFQREATSSPTELRSQDEARRWFVDRGLTVTDWSIARGFNPTLVYAVLHGRR